MDGVNQERVLIHVLLGVKNNHPDKFEKIDSYFLHSSEYHKCSKRYLFVLHLANMQNRFADDVDSNQLNLN